MDAGGQLFSRKVIKPTVLRTIRSKRAADVFRNDSDANEGGTHYEEANSSALKRRRGLNNIQSNNSPISHLGEMPSPPPVHEQTKEDSDDENLLERMHLIKTLQKMRGDSRGLNIKKLHKDTRKEEEDDEEEEITYGLLDKQFTSRIDGAPTQKDKHLEEFLSKRLYQSQQSKAEDAASDAREAELYKIPANLYVEDSSAAHADKMNWVTGLVEVPIPLDVKLKNIEATERAKRNLLRLGRAESRNGSNNVEDIVRTAFGSRFQNTDLERPRNNVATDDITLDRFRRRTYGH